MERNANGDRQKIMLAARRAVKLFSKIMGHQHDEVSHVILFNYIGMSMLCQTNTWELELSKANKILPELDEFYQYYLHDLNYASFLLKGDVINAKKSLDTLKSLDAPLLRNYRPIIQKRQLEQENSNLQTTFSRNFQKIGCVPPHQSPQFDNP